jgi:hypothetical protein
MRLAREYSARLAAQLALAGVLERRFAATQAVTNATSPSDGGIAEESAGENTAGGQHGSFGRRVVTSCRTTGPPPPPMPSRAEQLKTSTARILHAIHASPVSPPTPQTPAASAAATVTATLTGALPSLAAANQEDAQRVAQDLKMVEMMQALSPERRRFLLVAAAAQEWYGPTGVPQQLKRADGDHDSRISEQDYREWVKRVFEDRGGLNWRQFMLTALHTALPFVAFGFLDNGVMILSGDMIDRTVGTTLHLSAMGAAGMGGICSGTLGIQVHGLAEKAVMAIGFNPPKLTVSQRKHPSFFRATHVGGSVGICLGLTMGMLPLLFLPDDIDDPADHPNATEALAAAATAAAAVAAGPQHS